MPPRWILSMCPLQSPSLHIQSKSGIVGTEKSDLLYALTPPSPPAERVSDATPLDIVNVPIAVAVTAYPVEKWNRRNGKVRFIVRPHPALSPCGEGERCHPVEYCQCARCSRRHCISSRKVESLERKSQIYCTPSPRPLPLRRG